MIVFPAHRPYWMRAPRSSWSFHLDSVDVSICLSPGPRPNSHPALHYISPHSTTLTINFGLHKLSIISSLSSAEVSRRRSKSKRDIPRPRFPVSDLWSRLGTHRLLAPVGTFSIFLTTNIPSTTLPKTQCLPSRNSAGAHVMKNWSQREPQA